MHSVKETCRLPPLVNSMILTMPNVAIIVYSLVFIVAQNRVEGEIEKGLFIQFFYLTLVATLLEFLFVYYWQKHRVHIKYIDHIYSETELRVQVFRHKGGKIRNRLLIASGITTFLPLVIVFVYLILSLTAIKELNLDSISPQQKEILIGPWVDILDPEKENFDKLFYVNAVDSIIMLVGIGNSILVSFIYLLLFRAPLKTTDYLSETLTDHFILFKPRDIVSGDYYWATRLEEKLIIAVADCTGHGVPGAFVSMLGISYLNEIVTRSEFIPANQILEQLRKLVIKSLHQTGSKGETQDGIEIAMCVIDTRKNMLEYSGANRPIYIIRNEASAGEDKENSSGYTLMHINPDKMPIGIYEQETKPFTNNEIQLKKNDSIYLFSDGYVDQIGGPARKTFRSKYFKELLLDIQDKPMKEQKSVLVEKLEAWQGDVEQIDDILVVGIKI